MTTKIMSIIDTIKTLSLIEAAELVKAMEETFGVSAAAPVAAAGAPAAAAAAEPEKDAFRIEITESGAQKINVIKALREAAGLIGVTLGLKEAKDLVEGAPGVAFESVAKDNAKKIKDLLEAAGAKVKLS
jgi:large subunit ribosomal protein L7/L12